MFCFYEQLTSEFHPFTPLFVCICPYILLGLVLVGDVDITSYPRPISPSASRFCIVIHRVTQHLAPGKQSAKHVLEYVLTQLMSFKKLNQDGGMDVTMDDRMPTMIGMGK